MEVLKRFPTRSSMSWKKNPCVRRDRDRRRIFQGKISRLRFCRRECRLVHNRILRRPTTASPLRSLHRPFRRRRRRRGKGCRRRTAACPSRRWIMIPLMWTTQASVPLCAIVAWNPLTSATLVLDFSIEWIFLGSFFLIRMNSLRFCVLLFFFSFYFLFFSFCLIERYSFCKLRWLFYVIFSARSYCAYRYYTFTYFSSVVTNGFCHICVRPFLTTFNFLSFRFVLCDMG